MSLWYTVLFSCLGWHIFYDMCLRMWNVWYEVNVFIYWLIFWFQIETSWDSFSRQKKQLWTEFFLSTWHFHDWPFRTCTIFIIRWQIYFNLTLFLPFPYRSEHERHSPTCPFVRGEPTHNVPFSVTLSTGPAHTHSKNEKVRMSVIELNTILNEVLSDWLPEHSWWYSAILKAVVVVVIWSFGLRWWILICPR